MNIHVKLEKTPDNFFFCFEIRDIPDYCCFGIIPIKVSYVLISLFYIIYSVEIILNSSDHFSIFDYINDGNLIASIIISICGLYGASNENIYYCSLFYYWSLIFSILFPFIWLFKIIKIYILDSYQLMYFFRDLALIILNLYIFFCCTLLIFFWVKLLKKQKDMYNSIRIIQMQEFKNNSIIST